MTVVPSFLLWLKWLLSIFSIPNMPPVPCCLESSCSSSVQMGYIFGGISSGRKYLPHNCIYVILFCAENDHRLFCCNCSRIYWKTPFRFSVVPQCWLDGLVVLFTHKPFVLLFNLCSDLKKQLLKYRSTFMSVSQRNMFRNSAVKRINKRPTIRI